VAVLADSEAQLAWEARQRPRAGIAAIVAGILMIAGYLWVGVAFRDGPRAGFLESLAQAEQPGAIGAEPSLRTPAFQFYEDHAATVIGSSLVRALALIAFAWALTFLAVATRARRPELPRPVVYIGLFGAVLLAVASVLGGVRTVTGVSSYLDGSVTVDASREIGDDSLLITADIINQLGPLALAAGLFLISLNAMRVGLLTRFLGILGIISGVLTVAPQLMPLPVVQSFWLISLGLLMLGAVRGGAPPAWSTGNAEPWPSQREVAEARRARSARNAPAQDQPSGNGDGDGQSYPTHSHPSSKKRKRKRRG
jgi:hypothetical protein